MDTTHVERAASRVDNFARKRGRPHVPKDMLLYRRASLVTNRAPLESYSRAMARALWWSYGGEHFLMSEILL